jgi:hypothetical protein
VPECGHASCRYARDLIPASAAPSPLAADPLPASGLACDATVRRPIGGPRPSTLATARFRRVTSHPYKGETSASSVAGGGEEKSGSRVRAVIPPSTGGVAGCRGGIRLEEEREPWKAGDVPRMDAMTSA